MGRAGIEPDIENVEHLFVIGRIVFFAKKIAGRAGEPGIRPFFREDGADAGVDRFVGQNGLRFLFHEDRNRHPPGALARQHPIRAAFDHRADAVAPLRRIELRFGECGDREFTQGFAVRAGKRLVHMGKPLRRGAENHRRFRTPAMRIGMAQRALCKQRTGGNQFLDDGAIGIAVLALRRQDALADQRRQPRGRGERTIFRDNVERIRIVRGVTCEQRGHQFEVFFAMTGRGVHEASAGIGGDVIARKQRYVEFITLRAKGMGRLAPLGLKIAHARQRDLRMFGGLIGQHIGQRDVFALFAQRTFARFGNFINAIGERIGIGDGAIARNGPRRGGPDHHGKFFITGNGKLHIDRGRRFLVIFNFGFGQRGLFHWRPHHRAEAAIEKTVGGEFVQFADDHRLGPEIHRGVGIVPFPAATEPLDLFALNAQPMGGKSTAIAAKLIGGHVFLRLALGAVFLFHLPFDGQAVTIPARHVRRILAQHGLRADDEILQDVIEAGAGMNVAIGVDRPIVQHEQRTAFGTGADFSVKVHLLPAREPIGLRSRKARLHRKIRGRKKQRGAVIARGGLGFWLVGHRVGRSISGVSGRPARAHPARPRPGLRVPLPYRG